MGSDIPHLLSASATQHPHHKGVFGRPCLALGDLRGLPADLPLVPLLAVGEIFPVGADQLLHRAHVGAAGNRAEEGPVSLPLSNADPQHTARPHLTVPEKPAGMAREETLRAASQLAQFSPTMKQRKQ